MAMDHAKTVSDAISGAPREDDGCSAMPSNPKLRRLDLVAPMIEPLKVGLDDDSSIEEDDEDMFDDDAFTFGDEDFQALMSHEMMKRLPTSIKLPHQIPSHGRAAAMPPASPNAPRNPLLRSVSAPAISDKMGVDSMPSTATSSMGEFIFSFVFSRLSLGEEPA